MIQTSESTERFRGRREARMTSSFYTQKSGPPRGLNLRFMCVPEATFKRDVHRDLWCLEPAIAMHSSPTRLSVSRTGHSVQFLSLDTMYLTAALPALPLASRCRSVASALAPLLPRQPQAAARLTAHATCKGVVRGRARDGRLDPWARARVRVGAGFRVVAARARPSSPPAQRAARAW